MRLFLLPLIICLAACSNAKDHHVQNDPGGGATGAVSDEGTNASGAMNGFGAVNGDPVTNTGNLGSGSTESDTMNGGNQMGPASHSFLEPVIHQTLQLKATDILVPLPV